MIGTSAHIPCMAMNPDQPRRSNGEFARVDRPRTDIGFSVGCPDCGVDVSAGPPCQICKDGSRCCPCYHEDD